MSPRATAFGQQARVLALAWTGRDEQRALEWLQGVVRDHPAGLGDLDSGMQCLLSACRLDLLAYATGAGGPNRPRRELVWEVRARRLASAAQAAVAIATAAGARAVVLKGLALGQRYWRDALVRDSTDIDLLVARDDTAAVRNAFVASGYHSREEWVPNWYERRWFYHEALQPPESGQPNVELHWDFMRSGLGHSDVRALIAAATPVEACGVSLPTPSTPWQLVTNSAHCVHEVFRPRLLLDVAFVARAAGADDWREAVRIARTAGVAAMLYYAVTTSAERLGWEPPPVVTALRPSAGRDGIARRYLGAVPMFPMPSRNLLQLHHLANPLLTCDGAGCVSRIPYSMLTDRGNLTADLERARRRIGRSGR